MISTATIASTEPAHIIRRLCKHWGHKFVVDYDETRGRVELPFGLCLLTAGAGELTVRLEAAPDIAMDRFELVVADHVQRMMRDATHTWHWMRQSH